MACNTIEVNLNGALVEFSVSVRSEPYGGHAAGWYATRENRTRDCITSGHATREDAVAHALEILNARSKAGGK